MTSKIILKKSSVAAKAPVTTDVEYGELALNYQDGRLYYKKADNSIDYFSAASASGVTSVAGNTGAVTATQLLTAITTVDGVGSGLDADLLDGNNSNYFINTSSTAQTKAGNLTLTGTLSATTKSFVIHHPTKPGMQLRYGSLEGPENGVYIRGKTKKNIIELPEYWTKLVDPKSITVNLTPIGSYQNLFIEKIENNKVYVTNSNLVNKSVNYFFTVFAERCDVVKLEVEYAT